jgi:hypothetical protein
MRLFAKKRELAPFDWLVDHDDHLYRDHGRLRVTIIGSGSRWVYRVADRMGEIAARDSTAFDSQAAALAAARDDLRQSPVDNTPAERY